MSHVVVVGGGPAGLAAAIAVAEHGSAHVVVVEREDDAGGVPRHCAHPGFGIRDLHRVLHGPAYARRYVDRATRLGVEIRRRGTVTAIAGAASVTVTSPHGIERIAADAVVLATGCRERPRSARLVAGTRPAGVFTTGSLQQLVHLQHERVGRRAVVVGAEHVSFSAVLTLAHAGCETAAMVTEHPIHQSYAALAWVAAGRRGIPILTSKRVHTIEGRERVTAITLDDGRTIACDTVVFTGDWIPERELARTAGLVMVPGTRGPRVDVAGRTSVPGLFATGNLVHAAEAADVAALGGRLVGRAVRDYLEHAAWPVEVVPIECEPPLAWVWPNALARADRRAPSTFRLRVREHRRHADLVAMQGTRLLWRRHQRDLRPNRPIVVPARAVVTAPLTAEPVRFGLRS